MHLDFSEFDEKESIDRLTGRAAARYSKALAVIPPKCHPNSTLIPYSYQEIQ